MTLPRTGVTSPGPRQCLSAQISALPPPVSDESFDRSAARRIPETTLPLRANLGYSSARTDPATKDEERMAEVDTQWTLQTLLELFDVVPRGDGCEGPRRQIARSD